MKCYRLSGMTMVVAVVVMDTVASVHIWEGIDMANSEIIATALWLIALGLIVGWLILLKMED